MGNRIEFYHIVDTMVLQLTFPLRSILTHCIIGQNMVQFLYTQIL